MFAKKDIGDLRFNAANIYYKMNPSNHFSPFNQN